MPAPQTAQAPQTAPRPHGPLFFRNIFLSLPRGNATPRKCCTSIDTAPPGTHPDKKAPFAQKMPAAGRACGERALQLVLILSCDGHADLSQRVIQRALRFRTTTAAGIIPQLITAKATHSITLLLSPVSGGVVGLGSVVPESPGLGSGLGPGCRAQDSQAAGHPHKRRLRLREKMKLLMKGEFIV